MIKFYIKIFFFLLITSLYVNNKTFAAELVPKNKKSKSKKCDNSEEIYKKNKHLLYADPKETESAYKVMEEALMKLEEHAANKDGYGFYNGYYTDDMFFDSGRQKDRTSIEKNQYIIYNPNKYNNIINKYWDPEYAHIFSTDFVKRKIARVYTPNLVIIQQRSRKWPWSREKYFYALAAKFEISENKTAIVMTSANIIDHNRQNKKYFENKIVESANLFQTEIDSEDDIRSGKLKKMFVNLSGYIVERINKCVFITYIEYITGL
ncbi:fam-a protein [Plasmodium yoelii]|uniref:Fam-a protein n=2 Tax=Plasmodium yoelii TaxID=5861 RepID=A0AAE9WYN9_PLAYO|nr:fam-a protein [Plasmodium yoelii]WBY58984.1 fam-a protein [Plasmodium yoelii yoelii]CDU19181.1 fam-a protein [Plasmodium yoelii]VTZ79816.1 fam-a protein [Plasmodium yoelii]|eukprot:XP_022812536.1 fam-a protein [Plasmodium yoelii]